MRKPTVNAVAAISSQSRGLGLGNKLLWHIPEDLKHFKDLTTGHPVIMGRKTFESITRYLGGPLPNRQNIVLSSKLTHKHPDVKIVTSVESALAAVGDVVEVFVIGGADIYALFLSKTDRLYLTLVEDEPEADTFFPAYEDQFSVTQEGELKELDGLRYKFVTLERVSKPV